MYRVVIDPGVLVSALLTSRGAPAALYTRWQLGHFEIIVSPLLLAELADVLVRPRFRTYVSIEEVEAYVAVLKREAMPMEDLKIVRRLTRDPGDDYLVSLARASGAQYLISGDRDLTDLTDHEPPVLTPRRFLELLELETEA
jgi:putative PIN family toxin of toxin-antitoxin system